MENIVRVASERNARLDRVLKLESEMTEVTIGEKKSRTAYMVHYRNENREKVREDRRRRYHENKDKDREWRQNGLNRLREEVINHYDGRCAVCGETDMDILMVVWNQLTPDPLKSSGGSTKRYRDIRKAEFPEGYIVRCHNCNVKIRKIGRVVEEGDGARIDRLSDLLERSSV